MLKAFKYRILPTKVQSELINKHIGHCRFVYNLGLEARLHAYQSCRVTLWYNDLCKQMNDLKDECAFLKEANSQSLQQSLKNIDVAFDRFFSGVSAFPNFKNKHSRQSFKVPQYVKIVNGKLDIPKFKEGIKIVLHLKMKGDIKQATVSRTPTGKYFVSILCDTGESDSVKFETKEESTVGVDLGIKTFCVESNNKRTDNPKFLNAALAKLKYQQSRISKYKGKARKKRLPVLHEKIANQRRNFLQQTSTRLIRENQSIAIEDLNIAGMTKRCKPKVDADGKYLPNGQAAKSGLNKSILDAGWSMFVDMIEYKAKWNGVNILTIGRFEPSSKTCSCCGHVNHDLKLSDREWTCPSCGDILDRDFNAAINIKNFALYNIGLRNSRLRNLNEHPEIFGVMTSEIPLSKELE